MASPQRIFQIYSTLHAQVAQVAEQQQQRGEKLSGTVKLLLSGDPAKPLSRWAEEMAEIHGVLTGTHDDEYALEATQTFYWASLYAALSKVPWSAVDWPTCQAAAAAMPASAGVLAQTVEEITAAGLDAKPTQLFSAWCLADRIYRTITPAAEQLSIEQIFERDLQEMQQRAYFAPILLQVPA